ncbi:GNAT family N-acetyltransferase [Actinoplanes sp. NPDC049265]|uniref:GNAT family N-acetyltransferase n=1 Tax=Actinoplanes sp. NPDC049265 TaxID=3363902 RepID=UPI0037116752
MQIQTREALDPEVVALLMARRRELAASGVEAADAEDGHFLVAMIGGHAVAFGVWEPRGAGGAELTCVYVRPSFRGRGITVALTVALEEEALATGRQLVARPLVQ